MTDRAGRHPRADDSSAATTAAARILLVEDHPLYRQALAALLTASAGFEVVGEAADGRRAIELAAELRPDVVVMDLDLPVLSGIEATAAIIAANPAVRVLALTMHEDETVFAAISAGASGYLVKSASPAAVLAALRALAAGEVVFSEAVIGRLNARLAQAQQSAFPTLTGREREVLALLARGLANQPIANRLGISEKTVRNLVSTILVKLGARDRAAAIAQAKAAGLA